MTMRRRRLDNRKLAGGGGRCWRWCRRLSSSSSWTCGWSTSRSRRCSTTSPPRRCWTSPGHLLPALPGREPPSAVLREQGVTRKLARWRPPASPGADRPPAVFHAAATGAGPPAGPASAPCPCHESRRSSGQAPSPGPYPNRPRSSASVADRSSGPTAATPSAVLRPPAMAVPYAAAGIHPLAHPFTPRATRRMRL